MDATISVKQWNALAKMLLPQSQYEEIELDENENIDKRKVDMLISWIMNDNIASMPKLREALRVTGYDEISAMIDQDYVGR